MDLRFTYISPSILEQQGYTVKEAMVKTPEESWPPDSLKLVGEVLVEELEIENQEEKDLSRSRTLEVEVNCKDGSTIWTEAKVSFLRDQNGNPTGIIGVTRDISKRKLAEKALNKSEGLLKATLESTADGILVVDEKGQVIHTNNRFAKMWRIPNDLIKSKDDEKLLSYVLDQLIEPMAFLSKVQELYKTSKEDFDTLIFKDGRVFERYSRPLIIDGEIAGRVWSFRDVTEKRRAEEALIKSETD
jgi:PAS domain S-box-containing protein